MSAFLQLISLLPELLQLIKQIQAFIKEKQTEATVQENVKHISDAFATKDVEKLRSIFNS